MNERRNDQTRNRTNSVDLPGTYHVTYRFISRLLCPAMHYGVIDFLSLHTTNFPHTVSYNLFYTYLFSVYFVHFVSLVNFIPPFSSITLNGFLLFGAYYFIYYLRHSNDCPFLLLCSISTFQYSFIIIYST